MNYDNVEDYIKANEGWRAHLYKDSEGFDTIGYGFLIDKRKGGGLPKAVGDFWFNYLRSESLAELDRLVPFWRDMPKPAQKAIEDMAFNMGAVNFVTGWPQTWAAIERRDWDTVAANIAGSLYAKQVGKRADRNIDLFMSAAVPEPPKGLDDPSLAEDAESWFDEIEWRPWRW